MPLDKVTYVAGETPPEKIESYRVFSAWTVDFGTCDSGLTILAILSYQHSLMDNGGVFGQVCQEEFYSFRYRLLNGLQSAFQIVLFCNSASRDIVAKAVCLLTCRFSTIFVIKFCYRDYRKEE